MFRRSHHPDPDEVVLRLRRPGRTYDEPPSDINSSILHKEKLRSSRVLCAKFSPGRDIRITWNRPVSFGKYVRWLHEGEFQTRSVKDTLACILFSQKVEDSEFCKAAISNVVTLLKEEQKHLKDYLDKMKPFTIGEWGIMKGDPGYPARQHIQHLIIRFGNSDDVRRFQSVGDLYPPELRHALEEKHDKANPVSENASCSQKSNTAAQVVDLDGEESQTDAPKEEVTARNERRGHNDTNTNGLGLLPNADMASIIEAINRTLRNGQNMHDLNPDLSVGDRITDAPSNSNQNPNQRATRPVQANGDVVPSQQCSSTENGQTTNAKQGSPQEKIAGNSPQQKATSTSGSSTAMIQAKQELNRQIDKPQHLEKIENKPSQPSAEHDTRPSTPTDGHKPDEQKAGVKGQEVAADGKVSDAQEKPGPDKGGHEGGDQSGVEQGSSTDEDRKEGEDESACQ